MRAGRSGGAGPGAWEWPGQRPGPPSPLPWPAAGRAQGRWGRWGCWGTLGRSCPPSCEPSVCTGGGARRPELQDLLPGTGRRAAPQGLGRGLRGPPFSISPLWALPFSIRDLVRRRVRGQGRGCAGRRWGARNCPELSSLKAEPGAPAAGPAGGGGSGLGRRGRGQTPQFPLPLPPRRTGGPERLGASPTPIYRPGRALASRGTLSGLRL